jgi:RNA polymerase sigma-70 factor (ECF subfamily)
MAIVDGKAVCEGVRLELEFSFAKGNRSALRQRITQVFELLRDPVYRYLFRVLDSRDEAEDLTQEVFLRLYAHLQKGHAVTNVRAWVFRVAHNLAIDQQRKKIRLEPMDPAVQGEASDPAPGADKNVLHDEKYRRLQQALASLSSQERHCLELRAEGLSYKEIADIVEMRIPTLVKYLGRTIKKLARETAYD